MTFGDRLKHLRGQLSQTEAAAKAKITQQMWSKLESGRTDPRRSVKVRAIARAWGLSVEELLAGLPEAEAATSTQLFEVNDHAPQYSVSGDEVIRQAREYWDRAVETNRTLALMIAKIILILSTTPTSEQGSIPLGSSHAASSV